MKLTSVLSSVLSTRIRSNAILFFALIFLSLQSLILSVRLIPTEKTKALWTDRQQFISCLKDQEHKGGDLKWYKQPSQHPIDDNIKAPVHVKKEGEAIKLFLMHLSKKHAGVYECRHELDGKVLSSDKVEIQVYNDIDLSEKLGNKLSYVGTEGGVFTIPCTTRFDSDTNADTTAIYWYHNGQQIGEKEDPQFKVSTKVEQNVDYKQVKSILRINNLNKDHEGNYVCQAIYANPYLSNMKDISINLRVQFKPQFLENKKKVWISDGSEGPFVVNVTCLVSADPAAKFEWLTHDDITLRQMHQVGSRIQHMPHFTITDTENMSVLSLQYASLDELEKNFQDPDAKRRKFKCIARNEIGEAKQDFTINIGKQPEPPTLASFTYRDGLLILSINKTEVTPPIDMYRVEIDRRMPIHFNESHKRPESGEMGIDTYEIPVDNRLPGGEHQLTLYAHNPVGWSELNNDIPQALLIVTSGATLAQQYSALTLLASFLALRYAL